MKTGTGRTPRTGMDSEKREDGMRIAVMADMEIPCEQ